MNTRCRIRVMALLLAVALMALPVWADGVDKAVIADPYLLKAVESSQQEADAVKSLEVHHVSTLEGIEVLQALEELALYEVGDLDLSPLVRLPNLRALVIYADEPLSCPEVVGKLTSLRELTMDNCGLVDLTFLTPLAEPAHLVPKSEPDNGRGSARITSWPGVSESLWQPYF